MRRPVIFISCCLCLPATIVGSASAQSPAIPPTATEPTATEPTAPLAGAPGSPSVPSYGVPHFSVPRQGGLPYGAAQVGVAGQAPPQYAPGPPPQFASGAAPQSAPSVVPHGLIAEPAHGMLLLKNGETLEGKISAAGDFYLVVAENTEMQVRARDVEVACRNLDDVVAHKVARLNPRSVDDRIALAQWCIDRELYGIAARELTEAYRIDDTHPRIPLLERRMKAAMSPPRTVPPPPPPAAPAVDESTVNAALSGLSSEAVHDFTVRVQPLLMNYCATAGCHGPKPNSEFHLERVYLNELNDSRVVRRNLFAALNQIDRRAPATSKLLTVPLTPHGGGKNALFHAHNAEHYRQLAIWVGKAASAAPTKTAAPTTASATPATDPLLQRLPIAPPGGSPPSAPPAAPSPTPSPPQTPPSSPLGASAPAGNLPGIPPAVAATTAPTPVAKTPAAPAPVDPFDPEVFNRRRDTAKP